MTFITTFLLVLLAFAGGALLAWLVARTQIRATNPDEAFADVPETRAIGGRR